MKKYWFAWTQAALLAGVAGIALLLAGEVRQRTRQLEGNPERRGREIGAIRSVSGSAQMREASSPGWRSARANAIVHEADYLQTGDGSMSLVMLDKTMPVSLAENSMVVFKSTDDSGEEEIELEKGSLDLATLGEKRVRLKSGGFNVRSRPRHVEFVQETGVLPSDALSRALMELKHADLLLALVKKLGVADVKLELPLRLLAESERMLEQGQTDAAGDGADAAYEELLTLFRAAKRSQKAIVSVSRDANGQVRVQALQGEVTIQSPLKKITLKEGEGVKIASNGTPDRKRALLVPPTLAWPAARQIVWNQPRPALAWEPLAGASRYQLEVAGNADFTDLLLSATTDLAQWAPEMPLPDGVYYWRVRAVDRDEFVGMHAASEFQVRTDRVAPVLDLDVKGEWEAPR